MIKNTWQNVRDDEKIKYKCKCIYSGVDFYLFYEFSGNIFVQIIVALVYSIARWYFVLKKMAFHYWSCAFFSFVFFMYNQFLWNGLTSDLSLFYNISPSTC